METFKTRSSSEKSDRRPLYWKLHHFKLRERYRYSWVQLIIMPIVVLGAFPGLWLFRAFFSIGAILFQGGMTPELFRQLKETPRLSGFSERYSFKDFWLDIYRCFAFDPETESNREVAEALQRLRSQRVSPTSARLLTWIVPWICRFDILDDDFELQDARDLSRNFWMIAAIDGLTGVWIYLYFRQQWALWFSFAALALDGIVIGCLYLGYRTRMSSGPGT